MSVTTNDEPLTIQLRESAAQIRSGSWMGSDMLLMAHRLEKAAIAVDMARDAREIRRFSSLMTTKMARKAYEGAHGWPNIPVAHLWAMLREHVEKGDPIDIANFAMMIHHNAEVEALERQGA